MPRLPPDTIFVFLLLRIYKSNYKKSLCRFSVSHWVKSFWLVFPGVQVVKERLLDLLSREEEEESHGEDVVRAGANRSFVSLHRVLSVTGACWLSIISLSLIMHIKPCPIPNPGIWKEKPSKSKPVFRLTAACQFGRRSCALWGSSRRIRATTGILLDELILS